MQKLVLNKRIKLTIEIQLYCQFQVDKNLIWRFNANVKSTKQNI